MLGTNLGDICTEMENGEIEHANSIFMSAVKTGNVNCVRTFFTYPIAIKKFPDIVEKWFDAIVDSMNVELLSGIFTTHRTCTAYFTMSKSFSGDIAEVTRKLLTQASPKFIRLLIDKEFRPASVWKKTPETFFNAIAETGKYKYNKCIPNKDFRGDEKYWSDAEFLKRNKHHYNQLILRMSKIPHDENVFKPVLGQIDFGNMLHGDCVEFADNIRKFNPQYTQLVTGKCVVDEKNGLSMLTASMMLSKLSAQ